MTARSINARRISIVGQAVVVSVLGDQGCAGDALEVGTNDGARRTQSNENKTKIVPTASENQGKIDPRTLENRHWIRLGRF